MQFTPTWQGGFNPNAGGSTPGFDGNGGGAGLGETPASTSGFNGASLVSSNGNPLGGVYGQPGAFGNAPLVGGVPGVGGTNPNANTQTAWNTNFKPSFQSVGGYNPSQYADLNTANTLASNLGGNVLQTKMGAGDPFGVPPQASIDFGGGSPLNAGLLAERYAKYDKATADAMTRAELAMQGPRNDSPDASFAQQFQPLTGGTQALAPGANSGFSSAIGTNLRAPTTPSPTPLGSSPPPATSPTVPPSAGGPGTEPPVVNPLTPPASTTANNQQAAGIQTLFQLLQYLSQQNRPQTMNPYGNSRYYPNLPRTSTAAPVASQQTTSFNGVDPTQLLSLLLGF